MSTESASPRQSTDRPEVSGLRVDASGRRFVLTFRPGQSLPDHHNPSRLELRVLEGSGTLQLPQSKPLALAPDARVQLDAERPHSVTAGDDGLVLEVRTVAANCTCC